MEAACHDTSRKEKTARKAKDRYNDSINEQDVLNLLALRWDGI